MESFPPPCQNAKENIFKSFSKIACSAPCEPIKIAMVPQKIAEYASIFQKSGYVLMSQELMKMKADNNSPMTEHSPSLCRDSLFKTLA
mmetsp:Transcript_9099/g.21657  ORF Transcript_9099/g.21657 Transcript_9099/m.21657 type:complete len:88 (-) Transcript_9099:456-719(-)